MCISNARTSDSCNSGFRKMGRMSSNKMPGEGKSGNCRRAACNLILRLESSAALEGEEAASLLSEPSARSVGSGLGAGCEAVAGVSWARTGDEPRFGCSWEVVDD